MVNIEQKNQIFIYLKKCFGDKKILLCYQEVSYDFQVVENLYYCFIWVFEQELYDLNLSKICMNDWYDLKDFCQFYYSIYMFNCVK